MKIYGPYIRKDGRSHIITYQNKKRTTISYPRFLLEQHIQRKLFPTETIDHINNDFTDNRIENLQILTVQENIHKQHIIHPRKIKTFICPNCKKESTKYENYVKNNLKKGKQGPFCSRKCAGQYTYINPWI